MSGFFKADTDGRAIRRKSPPRDSLRHWHVHCSLREYDAEQACVHGAREPRRAPVRKDDRSCEQKFGANRGAIGCAET